MLRIIVLFFIVLVQMPMAVNAKARPKTTAPVAPAPLVEGFRYEYQLNRVDRKAIDLVGEDKQKTLRHMAEAAVLSDFCPYLKLDQDKFRRDFDALGGAGPKRSPAQQRDFENRLMTTFGIYVGLLVAEGVESDAKFCELASSIQQRQGPVSRYWVAATAPAPATVPESARK